MSEINFIFNDAEYSIDEPVVSDAIDSLKGYLNDDISGSGATIEFDGASYNVDSTKLSAAVTNFVRYLGLINGNGIKVVIGGTEYSVDSTKLAGAISEMHSAFTDLQGGELIPSEGLEFTSYGDGTCYVSGMGECTDTDIVIPKVSPTEDVVIAIGAYAFVQSGPTSIVIPDSVTTIGSDAFYNCSELKDVYYTGSAEEWAQISISGDNDPLLNATIHYNYIA